MLIKTNAIVFSTLKYGDSSLIARCYCKELGLKSFMLKSILSSKKGQLKKSLFQPLNIITLITQVKNENKDVLINFNPKIINSREILAKVEQAGIVPYDFDVTGASLETVFLSITQKP